jgi:hypothetical protein
MSASRVAFSTPCNGPPVLDSQRLLVGDRSHDMQRARNGTVARTSMVDDDSSADELSSAGERLARD